MGKLYRVLIWGKNAVGKTSVIEQLAYGRTEDKVWWNVSIYISLISFEFLQPYRETIEDTYCIQYDSSSNEKDIVLRVHDIGGVVRDKNFFSFVFHTLINEYFRKAHRQKNLVVFDIY